MSRFLVVDDDDSSVHGMTRLLRDDGHDVVPFTAGKDAVDAIGRHAFDVVVTNVEMPHVDGHAVVAATRDNLPTACVVAVSARADDHAHALTHAGACIVADKPIDYESITRAVAECRARGGPANGRCHMRRPHGGPVLTVLRRR